MEWKNFIQWKGTDVCIDLICECGEQYHYDGGFLYAWKCGECGAVYEMGSEVEMKRKHEELSYNPIMMNEENQ